MAQRLTYRRRHSYATRSNLTRKVKTPGGKLVYHYVQKKGSAATDPTTKQVLNGVPVLRPSQLSRSQTNKKDRTVHRPYGGVLSGANVRNRIIRAFLIEEQKIVKKVLKMQQKKDGKK
eukprot:CAMPEP_0198239270 /NCGR_PEP_ID=MMETSP1446-20131203/4719_1 /TAXON_ID=1461542 ORGANISM="Unidentified sp, Strain CCMP2111" /NCGR_SAMPLE_ID=MMETSP1446 /ASSEMBLY_ACC=CAM_ASM_001112 /LENGTH=117 /DNA_ID=CAMNT_0043921825 /DNA_START=8 /DNA_END=361 /DNA_ORIENTATION=-